MRCAAACLAVVVSVALAPAGCGRSGAAPSAPPVVNSTLAPSSDPATGTLDVGDIGAAVRLVSDSGKRDLAGNAGRWSLAPGTYRAESITLDRKDKDGNDWYIFASAKGTPAAEFQIAANQVTRLKLGPPIIVGAEVSLKDGEAIISVQLTGQGGERYGAYSVLNENLKGAPNINITNELGEDLESGQFRYG